MLPAKKQLPGFINIGKPKVGDFFIPDSCRGKYQGSEELGTGGYGTVAGLKDETKVRKDLAIKKFINPFDHPKKAQRCFRELQLVRELNHDNIVKMKFAYTTDKSMKELNEVYLATEYCGKDLGKRLEDETVKKHFKLEDFQRMISELLRALKYLNSANVIHRDLKPDNIAINDDGKLTLLDFGIARVKEVVMTCSPGTRLYRAIETISFSENDRHLNYNEKADMWSIGTIICEMLTGNPIFEDEFPILKTIKICGQIPKEILDKMVFDYQSDRNSLEKWKEPRIDFKKYFRRHARPWLLEDIEKHMDAIVDFIDSTLDYDPNARMSVVDALDHAFLKDVRDRKREVADGHSIADVGDRSLENWRELIWASIQANPVRFDDPVLA